MEMLNNGRVGSRAQSRTCSNYALDKWKWHWNSILLDIINTWRTEYFRRVCVVLYTSGWMDIITAIEQNKKTVVYKAFITSRQKHNHLRLAMPNLFSKRSNRVSVFIVSTCGTQLQLLDFSSVYIPEQVYNKTYDWWDTDLGRWGRYVIPKRR
jgi:hypothetical protein